MKSTNISVAIAIRCLLCLKMDQGIGKNTPFLKNSELRTFDGSVSFVENNTTATKSNNIDKEDLKISFL